MPKSNRDGTVTQVFAVSWLAMRRTLCGCQMVLDWIGPCDKLNACGERSALELDNDVLFWCERSGIAVRLRYSSRIAGRSSVSDL
jgi:hypothetical protein